MKVLHILNGDCTDEIFRQTHIEGDVLVWREMLCEGKIPFTNDFNEFWKLREEILVTDYGFDPVAYRDRVTQPASNLLGQFAYDEIILWFEFDLFCQANQLYILNFFAGQSSHADIFLVNCDHHEEIKNFKGYGELNPRQLSVLISEKSRITEHDLNLAAELWKLFISKDANDLLSLHAHDYGNLILLRNALLAHRERMPSPENGLNLIEKTLLTSVHQNHLTAEKIYNDFWNAYPVYGFGDFQLDRTLSEMEKWGLLQKNDHWKITERGLSVLNNERNYFDFIQSPRFLINISLN